jgi:hypothetical protein
MLAIVAKPESYKINLKNVGEHERAEPVHDWLVTPGPKYSKTLPVPPLIR